MRGQVFQTSDHAVPFIFAVRASSGYLSPRSRMRVVICDAPTLVQNLSSFMLPLKILWLYDPTALDLIVFHSTKTAARRRARDRGLTVGLSTLDMDRLCIGSRPSFLALFPLYVSM
jgi:hypothetical protein